jgi:DNA-binding MarR family transcriptional regulator
MDDERSVWRRSATEMLHALVGLKGEIEAQLVAAGIEGFSANEALLTLYEHDGPLRMNDIATHIGLTASSATKVVDRLEGLGYVERSPDSSDRRASLVHLTSTGLRAGQRSNAVVERVVDDLWSRHLTAEEARMLIRIADRVRGRAG